MTTKITKKRSIATSNGKVHMSLDEKVTFSLPQIDDTSVKLGRLNQEILANIAKDSLKDNNENQYKIVSWNVSGLTAALKKNFREYIEAEDPDILVLQETKLNENLKDFFPQYPYQFWNHCVARHGYSGTAILSKIKPISSYFGLDSHIHHNLPQNFECAREIMDKEGRLITIELESCLIVNAYIPNAGMKLERLQDKLKATHLLFESLKNVRKLYNKPILLAGDINIAHDDIDLARPTSNHKTAGFTQEERTKFKELLQLGYVDIFRHFHPDKKDEYTYWGYRFNTRSKNIGWRLDYFLSTSDFVAHTKNCFIRKEVYGPSDHVPIVLIWTPCQ